MRRFWCLIGVWGLSVFLTGCEASPRVQGTVTLDGKPLDQGSINFEPVDRNKPSFGATISNGRYQVSASSPVTAGKFQVQICGSIKTGRQVPAGPPSPPGTMTDEFRYYPAEGVEVREAEILPGQVNELNFELNSSAKSR